MGFRSGGNFFFQAEDGIRDLVRSRGLGDVYKRQVIRGVQSREEDVRKGCAFVTAISKFPLIVKSCPGFLVNRVLAPTLAVDDLASIRDQ